MSSLSFSFLFPFLCFLFFSAQTEISKRQSCLPFNLGNKFVYNFASNAHSAWMQTIAWPARDAVGRAVQQVTDTLASCSVKKPWKLHYHFEVSKLSFLLYYSSVCGTPLPSKKKKKRKKKPPNFVACWATYIEGKNSSFSQIVFQPAHIFSMFKTHYFSISGCFMPFWALFRLWPKFIDPQHATKNTRLCTSLCRCCARQYCLFCAQVPGHLKLKVSALFGSNCTFSDMHVHQVFSTKIGRKYLFCFIWISKMFDKNCWEYNFSTLSARKNTFLIALHLYSNAFGLHWTVSAKAPLSTDVYANLA